MKKTGITLGLVLIIIGIIFLGNNFNLWNIDLFFKGWWALFIIVPSLVGLFEDFKESLITLILGILLLLAAQDIIDWSMIWKILVPFMIIIIGLSLIFNSFNKSIKISKNSKHYVSIFGEANEKIKEIVSDFKVVSVFGAVNLDLRDAKLDKDLVIECVSVFGGSELIIPKNVKVVSNGIPIFGELENRHTSEDSKHTIYINYVAVFGSIDIK